MGPDLLIFGLCEFGHSAETYKIRNSQSWPVPASCSDSTVHRGLDVHSLVPTKLYRALL